MGSTAPTGSAPPLARTLGALLQESAAGAAAADAVVTTTGRTSRRDLLDGVARAAAALRRAGVRRGDRVALLLDNRVEWLEVALGATALGATAAPINTWVKSRDLAYLLGHSRPTVLVTLDALGRQDYVGHLRELLPDVVDGDPGRWTAPGLPELRELVVLGEAVPPGARSYADWLGTDPPEELCDRAEPDDVALVPVRVRHRVHARLTARSAGRRSSSRSGLVKRW